jgi:hypothetical protein
MMWYRAKNVAVVQRSEGRGAYMFEILQHQVPVDSFIPKALLAIKISLATSGIHHLVDQASTSNTFSHGK